MNNTKSWHLKVVSVIMAVLLWLFITNESLIIKQQDVTGVSLKAINLSSGLSASYPEEVTVSIVGTPRSAREINAYIDLKGKEPGVYTVPVQVEQMPGTRVSSVTPAEVRVEITQIGEYIFPVSYRVREEPPAGYRVAGVDVTPEKCVVRGQQEKINQVDSLLIYLDLGSVRDTEAIAAQVAALDRYGKPVTGVEIMPGKVQAYVVVEKTSDHTVVAVSPSLTGNPPEGFVVRDVTTTPSEVTLIGSEQDLTGIDFVKTKPVDLAGRNRSFKQEVELVAIPGIKIFPAKVTVMVDIAAAEHQEEPGQ